MVAVRSLLFVPLVLPVYGKNIVEMITYRDENKRLHKRLAPEEYKGGDFFTDESALRKRDLIEHPPVSLDAYFAIGDDTQSNIDIPNTYLDSQISVLKEVDIFASYSRNDEKVYDMFRDPESDLIVIAPTNEAFTVLSKKPWQFPTDIDDMEERGSSVRDIDNAIHSNIVHFVRSHVVSFQKDVETYKDGTVLLKSDAYRMDYPNKRGGDILLRRNGDTYSIASVNDGIYHPVEGVHLTRNGVILMVHACLSKPNA
ncbi:Uncharacterized protein RNJ44_01809 [Nakaseomyces bracarensis]|uniref:FAS1 domain-containing protein n=1 Tax=Nakaseomyces bracarensis TaxID=273131 RepID=A0ABR4NNU7_9SACH